MCDGVVETIGQLTFEGQMKAPFTAHPKKHPTTGKLHAFGYQVRQRKERVARKRAKERWVVACTDENTSIAHKAGK